MTIPCTTVAGTAHAVPSTRQSIHPVAARSATCVAANARPGASRRSTNPARRPPPMTCRMMVEGRTASSIVSAARSAFEMSTVVVIFRECTVSSLRAPEGAKSGAAETGLPDSRLRGQVCPGAVDSAQAAIRRAKTTGARTGRSSFPARRVRGRHPAPDPARRFLPYITARPPRDSTFGSSPSCRTPTCPCSTGSQSAPVRASGTAPRRSRASAAPST